MDKFSDIQKLQILLTGVFLIFCQRTAWTQQKYERLPEGVQDHRVVVDRQSAEYHQLNAVGVVTVDVNKLDGTGFLVSPCVVMTNKHVIRRDINVRIGDQIFFAAGQTGDSKREFQHNSAGRVVAHGPGSLAGEDWALVKLEKSLGNEVGYIQVYQMDTKMSNGRALITAGFPADRTKYGTDLSKIYGDLNCKGNGLGPDDTVVHTCQATGGQSGSPVLTKAPNGKYYAIGMIQGSDGSGLGRGGVKGEYNIAVNFESGKKYGIVAQGDKIVSELSKIRCE